MNITVIGGTGLIGRPLVQCLLGSGHDVRVVSRRPHSKILLTPHPSLSVETWDGRFLNSFPLDASSDIVINLAGENIAQGRWTPAKKKLIRQSRVGTTQALYQAMNRRPRRPQLVINASAVGAYGDCGESIVTEDQSWGSGFLPEVCKAWEAEAYRADSLGVRVICLRTGIVLSREGGALKKFLTAFRFFAGGPLGSGYQWFPWVHIDDVIGSIQYMIEHRDLKGAVNIVSPHPARMTEFCKILGRVLRRPSWLRIPEIGLKFLLGETAEMILMSQRVKPRKLVSAGYVFRYPDLHGALESLLGERKSGSE